MSQCRSKAYLGFFRSNSAAKQLHIESMKCKTQKQGEINIYTLSIDYFEGVEIDKTTIPTIDAYNKWVVVD